ncbi:hypothetical protein AB395_0000134 [Sinorhizobium fredii CCBAU 45436]|nr:hypothetical protein AB395_0000134 [Sinorhizobium fredii CCBAU 45436]
MGQTISPRTTDCLGVMTRDCGANALVLHWFQCGSTMSGGPKASTGIAHNVLKLNRKMVPLT